MISVFLVDDHELVRTGIRRIIEDVRGMKVAGEADSGEEAVKWCRTNHADVILMDMNMPGIGGLEATKKLLRVNPDIKIIVLTVHTENPFPTKVMQAVPQVISRRARHRMKWSMRSVSFTAVSVTFLQKLRSKWR